MSYEKFERLPGVSPAPRPFPGAYPTRMRIKTTRGNLNFEYVGKPVPSLKDLVGRRFLRVGGDVNNLIITEFDQNGVVRELRGGGLNQASTFADLYFPMPQLFWDYLGRVGRTLAMLDRESIVVDGIPAYTNRFWKDTAWEEKARKMTRDAVHARLGRRWFTVDEYVEIVEFIDRKCVGRWTLPPVTPQPPPNRRQRRARERAVPTPFPPTGRMPRPMDVEAMFPPTPTVPPVAMDIETAPAPPWAMTAQTLQQVAADLRQVQVVPEARGQQVYFTANALGAWGDPVQVQQMPTEGAVGTALDWGLDHFINERNAQERAQQLEAHNHQREELARARNMAEILDIQRRYADFDLAQDLGIEPDAEWRA